MTDHRFYEDEIRCDFIVPSMIKRTWAAQLEILSDLDRACAEHGLSYFAEWGTLLGAVRHGGFIPWDDDLDICMKRKDYDRFVKNTGSIVPEGCSIVNYRSNPDFKQMLSRIVSSDHYRFDPEYMRKYSGLPFALGIDIFPLDFMTDDEEYERDREERIRLVYDAVNEMAHFGTDPADIKDHLKKVEGTCSIRIDYSNDVLRQLRELLEVLFAEVDEKDASYITLYPLWMNGHRYRFPKDHYDRPVRMMFENTSIPVPVCYDDILKLKYGNNYMTPVRSGGAHEYPYYEMHEKILKDSFGFEWPSYKFSANDLADPRKRTETFDGGSAVFVTYLPAAFENMRRIVKQYLRKGYDVTILLAKRYDIAPDMSGIVPAAEDVSDELYLTGLEGAVVSHDPGILGSHPDEIITDFPYDEYNLITTVDKEYYSTALRKCCSRLIYVPPFEAKSMKADDERAKKLMPQYVCTPMCAACDEIILGSFEMKERYVECLTDFSGEKYRDYWQEKISVSTDNTADTVKSPADGGKKKILFYVGLATFAQYKMTAIEKIERAFRVFDENSDSVEAVYLLQEGLLENLCETFPELYKEYMARDFRPEADYVDTDVIDAYYGEASMFATEFVNTRKPVMIMDVNI